MPRDFSVPYSEEELEGLKDIFRSLPTFKDEGYILSSDLAAVVKAMNYDRTPEQVAAYKAYYDKQCGGIVVFSAYLSNLRALHDTSKFGIALAESCDKDKNGFISADEFANVMEMLTVHNPNLIGISFDEFGVQADANADGKVSVEACGKWIDDYLHNV